MRILLLGANGRTGGEVIEKALQMGDEVTAVVRDASRALPLAHQRLRKVVGDVCDPSFLTEIAPGHDLVVSTLGPRMPTSGAARIYSDSASAMVAGLRDTDVERMLVTSSGLLDSEQSVCGKVLRAVVPRIVEEAGKMESCIQGSTLRLTIVRTGFLNDKPSDSFKVDSQAGAISRRAVANFLVKECHARQYLDEVVGLCSQAR